MSKSILGKEILSELKEAFIDSDFRYLEQVTMIIGDRKRDWLRRDILKKRGRLRQ